MKPLRNIHVSIAESCGTHGLECPCRPKVKGVPGAVKPTLLTVHQDSMTVFGHAGVRGLVEMLGKL
jgi:hypothetical protein